MLGTGVISFPFIFFVHSVVHQTIFLIEDGIRCIVTHKAPPHLLKVFQVALNKGAEIALAPAAGQQTTRTLTPITRMKISKCGQRLWLSW